MRQFVRLICWDQSLLLNTRVLFISPNRHSSAAQGVFSCDDDLGCGSLQLGFCCHTLDGLVLQLQIKWTVTEARGGALIVTATNQWPRYCVLLDTTGLHRQNQKLMKYVLIVIS